MKEFFSCLVTGFCLLVVLVLAVDALEYEMTGKCEQCLIIKFGD